MAVRRTSPDAEQTVTGPPSPVSVPLVAPKLPRTRERRGGSDGAMVELLDRIRRGERERRSFRDRRATPRVVVELSVEVRAAGVKSPLRSTHDLSTFGLSVRSGPALRAGTPVLLTLFLPDEPAAPLELHALVVAPFHGTQGLRVKFVDPPLATVRRIHRLIAP